VAAHEIGVGNFLADTMPEAKAAELRTCSPVRLFTTGSAEQPVCGIRDCSRVPGRSSSASSDESAGSERRLPVDVQHAVALLSRQIADPHSEVAAHFDAGRPLAAACAPGRLDVMGRIADYSGSTVLQLPLAESAVVLCQTLLTPEVRIFSVERDQP
jgi:hypothetical protein